MINLSTGLVTSLAGTYGFSALMNGGIIRLFDGQIPASADLAVPSGAKELARITTEGKTFYPVSDENDAGLEFSVSAPGNIISVGQWVLKGIALGTVTWFRWNWSGVDTNGYSVVNPRLDGTVGLTEQTGIAMALQNLNIAPGYTVTLDSVILTFPQTRM